MLKTRRQWRKEDFRRVKKGERPADHFTVRYIYRRQQVDIAPDGSVTTGTFPVLKERQIPLYSGSQTQAYQRIGAVLLRDAYCRYFVDDARKDSYLWWQDEEWKTCQAFLADEHIRQHLLGKEIYGVFGGQFTCFSAIDADYHGGDYELFREQLTAVLEELHGHDGWHYSFGPRGCHIIRVHPRTPTAKARANLRQLLQRIDARHPDLRERVIQSGMKPISDWEIYPDPNQGFRLPFARGRVLLLDKPCFDLRAYIEWQIEPRYCLLEDVLAEIFKVIQPVAAAEPAKEEKKKKREQSEVGRVFGKLRGRYAKVLVDFWSGRNNLPDSLNCAILLTARMMPFYFDDGDDAIDFIEELIDDLPDVSFSDRLLTGKRKAVSRIVRQAVKVAYEGNSHQPDPELSTEKLAKTFRAWQSNGFSLVDRSTWGASNVLANDFSFTAVELQGIAYFSRILKADLQTTADATRHLLRLLAGHVSGQMSVRYVKNLLVGFGISCGHHGKVNEYLEALCQAGWISLVAGHVLGRRGRLWQVGERMLGKLLTTTNKPTPASIICVPPHGEQRGFSFTSYNKPSPASIFVSHFPMNNPNLRKMESKVREIVGAGT